MLTLLYVCIIFRIRPFRKLICNEFPYKHYKRQFPGLIPCASVSKRVLVQNISNEKERLQINERKRWNRELTLKCKLKCYVKPMKDPLGVSSRKGNQAATRGKEKIILTSLGIEPTTSGLNLPLLCRLSYEVQRTEKVRCSSHSTLIYTSEIILCSTK